MSNFIYDDTDLLYPKTNLNPIPGGGSEDNYVDDNAWNKVNQACVDIKTVLRGGDWYGLAENASDPAPAGIDEYVWLDDAGAYWLHLGGVGGTDEQLNGSASGETNTASNVNTAGVGVYKQKVGVDLQFKGIAAGSSKISVTDTGGTNSINVDVVEANIAHQSISGAGTKTHANIDTHMGLFEGKAQGSLWVSSGSVAAALAQGTSGQVLTSQGAAADPVWAASALTMQDGGSPLANTPHSTINFVGVGVTAADAGAGVVTVTIPGGSGSLTVGSAINGGAINRILYEDSSRLLAEHANFTWNGQTFSVTNIQDDTTAAMIIQRTTTGLGFGLKVTDSSDIGASVDITSTSLTTGDALRITVDNTMTTGRAIRVLGGAAGATEVFNVDEDGAVYAMGITVAGNLVPEANNTRNLGTMGSAEWAGVYTRKVRAESGTLELSADEFVHCDGDWDFGGGEFYPTNDSSTALGKAGKSWSDVHSDKLTLQGSTSGTMSQQAAATTTNHTLTWPAALAATTGYILSSTDAGIMSWVTPPSGGTLNDAYNAGATITVDATGAVTIADNTTTATASLRITREPAFGSVGTCVEVLIGPNTPGDAINVDRQDVRASHSTKFGLVLRNSTDATGTYITQNSPALIFGGSVHDGFEVDNYQGSIQLSGERPGELPSSSGYLDFRINNPSSGWTDPRLRVTASGVYVDHTMTAENVIVSQTAKTSSAGKALSVVVEAHTDQIFYPTQTEFNYSQTITYSSAAGVSEFQSINVKATTLASSAGAKTITSAGTVVITGAPAEGTDVTITNPYSLWVKAGVSRFADASVSGKILVDSAGSAIGNGATSSLNTALVVEQNFGDNQYGVIGILAQASLARTTAAIATTNIGIEGQSVLESTHTQNLTATIGMAGVSSHLQTNSSSTGTVTGAALFYAKSAGASGSAVTNMYGVYVADQTGGTNNYSIYTVGTAICRLGGEIEIDGAFNHDGSTFGAFNTTPVTQPVSAADLTNNVTTGGTSDQVDDWTDLSTYATDAAAIRNAIYQLTRKLKQVNDGLRDLGLLS